MTGALPPLDPRLAAMAAKAARHPPMHRVPLEALRAAAPRQLATALPKEGVASVEDVTIDGPAGPIGVRVYRPDNRPGRPLIVFFHGSAFVFCSVETHDGMCRQICNRAESVVVSVDYRLAPEHPFPAGPLDCAAATRWAFEHAERFGCDGRRLAVCGDSAGGNMAIGVALRARAEGGPPLKALALVYPVTDHHSARHPSYDACGRECGLTGEEMRAFWDLYLPDASAAGDPCVSPLRAPSLAGLPPAFVATAGHDILRDEGEAFARALGGAGVPVSAKRYAAMNHGFLNWVGVVDGADEAMDDLTAWLRATL